MLHQEKDIKSCKAVTRVQHIHRYVSLETNQTEGDSQACREIRAIHVYTQDTMVCQKRRENLS